MADEEEVEYVPGQRSQTWIHEAHVEYLEAEYPDLNLAKLKPAELIAVAFASRRDYRASEVYEEAKAEHVNSVEEERARLAEERAEAKAQREAERAEKAAAKSAKKGEASKSKATAKKGSKATKAKSTGKSTRGRKTKPSSEDPFED